jgi:hypothetical protein
MTLHLDVNSTHVNGESRRLWQDHRVWWVNCVAIEAAWSQKIAREDFPDARRARDTMLAALVANL